MTADDDTRATLTREIRRARLHACALRAESLRLMARSRRERERSNNFRLIALLRLAEGRQAVTPKP